MDSVDIVYGLKIESITWRQLLDTIIMTLHHNEIINCQLYSILQVYPSSTGNQFYKFD